MADAFSALKHVYLSVYNWTVFVSGFQVLYFAVKTLKESGHAQVYDVVERPLQLAQTAVIMEVRLFFLQILHGLVGELYICPSLHLQILPADTSIGPSLAVKAATSSLPFLLFVTLAQLYRSAAAADSYDNPSRKGRRAPPRSTVSTAA